MSLNVVQEAFTEGRTTDTAWIKSKAKGDQNKLQAFIDNQQHFNTRTMGEIRPLQRLDPVTGEVIDTFPSRLAAAKWVVANVLKDPNRDPISMTGNFMTCMELGYKCYGFYWKEITVAQLHKGTAERAKAIGGTAVWAYGHKLGGKTSGSDGRVFASVKEASRHTGIPETTIRNNMHDSAPRVGGLAFRVYNEKPLVRTFKSITDAATALGVNTNSVTRKVTQNQAVNNVTIRLAKPLKRGILANGVNTNEPTKVIVVSNGQRLKTVHPSFKAAAKYLGCDDATVAKHLRNGTTFKKKYTFLVG